jgi:flotillin
MENISWLQLIAVMRHMFQVAAEVAAPLSQAKKITMVSSGQGEIGAAKLTGEVLSIVSKVPEVVKNLTGVDIIKVIRH